MKSNVISNNNSAVNSGPVILNSIHNAPDLDQKIRDSIGLKMDEF